MTFDLWKEHNCFACGRPLTSSRSFAMTTDGQFVALGLTCQRKVKKAEPEPYQPPKGGPALVRPTRAQMEEKGYF